MGKRIFDIVCAGLALILLAPLFLLIALSVYLTIHRTFIFAQKRVGLGGRVFTLLKFRTLSTEWLRHSPYVTRQDDPRVPPLGRLLRSTHLDELPQLWNVLRGDMSLVGPRPTTLTHHRLYLRSNLSQYKERYRVKPGLTGLAQVCERGKKHKMECGRLRLDLLYTQHRTFCMDFVLLVKTIPLILNRQGI